MNRRQLLAAAVTAPVAAAVTREVPVAANFYGLHRSVDVSPLRGWIPAGPAPGQLKAAIIEGARKLAEHDQPPDWI